MINTKDILETINMIREENLDIRTVTMGISLFDCITDDQKKLEEKIYEFQQKNKAFQGTINKYIKPKKEWYKKFTNASV